MPATNKSKAPSSNWTKLKEKIVVDNSKTEGHKKRKRTDITDFLRSKSDSELPSGPESDVLNRLDEAPVDPKDREKYVGLDCEMVGVGSNAKMSVLARCCLVDFDGEKIYDEFVRPKSFVTDFRTKYSGVRKSDLRKGKAVSLEECMQDVSRLLEGKVLVGHALHNDLDVLMMNHHRHMIRDTACYHPYMRPHGREGGKMRPRSLRELTKQYLGLTIQEGEHDPGIDAKMAMLLYRRTRKTWEASLAKVAKEKRNKGLLNAQHVRELNSANREGSGSSSGARGLKHVAHSAKKFKTAGGRPKSSMFDNCS